jgi:hypothetical protein
MNREERIPKKLLSLITKYFNGDKYKANLWFLISNPDLHGLRPKDYKPGGTWDALEKKIMAALEIKDENANASVT